jgi:hypothetical protein
MKTLFVEKKAMEIRYERACLLLYPKNGSRKHPYNIKVIYYMDHQ